MADRNQIIKSQRGFRGVATHHINKLKKIWNDEENILPRKIHDKTITQSTKHAMKSSFKLFNLKNDLLVNIQMKPHLKTIKLKIKIKIKFKIEQNPALDLNFNLRVLTEKS